MLRLSIRENRSVFLFNDEAGYKIRVKVLKLNPQENMVELGFSAPRDVRILRDKLYREKNNSSGNNTNNQAENQ